MGVAVCIRRAASDEPMNGYSRSRIACIKYDKQGGFRREVSSGDVGIPADIPDCTDIKLIQVILLPALSGYHCAPS